MAAGVEILRIGGSALDAVEAACQAVEDNLNDHSVGTGGYPNQAGEVDLDASIMKGTTPIALIPLAFMLLPWLAKYVWDKLTGWKPRPAAQG